jgi:hypothetical protein
VAKRTTGNGSSKFPVHTDDMGGWIRVHTDAAAAAPADLPVYLSLTLTDWFRQRPQLRLTTVVPVCRDGATVELHAWYELHVFPDLTRKQTQPAPGQQPPP